LWAFLGQVIVPIDLSYAVGGGWFFRLIGRWSWWVYEHGMLAICGTVKIVTRQIVAWQNRHIVAKVAGRDCLLSPIL